MMSGQGLSFNAVVLAQDVFLKIPSISITLQCIYVIKSSFHARMGLFLDSILLL